LRICHNLPGSTGRAQALSHRLFDRPQAYVLSFIDVLSFIEFKNIAFLSWPEPIGYWLGFASLSSCRFLSHRVSVLRLTPKIRLIARFDPRSR
jgi:hypothetical protein